MAKSYPTPTTGYVDNGGLVELGKDNIAATWDQVYLPKPKGIWRVNITGSTPTTDSDKAEISVSIFEASRPIVDFSGTWAWQGQSSANAQKKNWKIKATNGATGNALTFKIGDYLPLKKLTLKGYATDRTISRDVLTPALWREMRRYPTGLLASEDCYAYFTDVDFASHLGALFSTDGFPCEVWLNGDFLGLYVMRTDNDPTAYLMDTSNSAHILMQPDHAWGLWGGAWSGAGWSISSPAIDGYQDKQDITTVAPDVAKSCQRFMAWAVGCSQGTMDARATYRKYLDLQSLLDYVIISELTNNYDSGYNNFMLGCHQATPTSGVWSFWLYDTDATWGLDMIADVTPETMGWVYTDAVGSGLFYLAHTIFRPEIRARWRVLRDAAIISSAWVAHWLTQYSAVIPPESLKADLSNWPLGNNTGSVDSLRDKERESYAYIIDWATRRIAWIDAQWGYSGA